MSNVYVIIPLLKQYGIIDVFKTIQKHVWDDEKDFWKGYNILKKVIGKSGISGLMHSGSYGWNCNKYYIEKVCISNVITTSTSSIRDCCYIHDRNIDNINLKYDKDITFTYNHKCDCGNIIIITFSIFNLAGLSDDIISSIKKNLHLKYQYNT